MTITAHTLTGIAIAVTIQQPILAPVLALLSHIVLDALPHYSNSNMHPWNRWFIIYYVIDALLALVILGFSFVLFLGQTLHIFITATAAVALDLLWAGYYSKLAWRGPLFTFLSRIQWAEKPWGAFIEFPYIAGMLYALFILAGILK